MMRHIASLSWATAPKMTTVFVNPALSFIECHLTRNGLSWRRQPLDNAMKMPERIDEQFARNQLWAEVAGK